jgi:hypothetical protein
MVSMRGSGVLRLTVRRPSRNRGDDDEVGNAFSVQDHEVPLTSVPSPGGVDGLVEALLRTPRPIGPHVLAKVPDEQSSGVPRPAWHMPLRPSIAIFPQRP